jgi:hypothetical protein
MALSIIAQAVNAVSAPCPMLDAAMDHTNHQMMMSGQQPSSHDMTTMNHSGENTDESPKMENCCGDESCPMNTFVIGFVFPQPVLLHNTNVSRITNIERAQSYLSLSSASLYRPPIFA